MRVDPATNRVEDRIPAGNAPGGVAAGFGALWVTSDVDRTLARIDQRTAARSEIDLGARPTAVAADARAVWVTSEEGGVVFRIEPRLGEVTDTIGVGNGPVAVAVGEGAVWVVNRPDANVHRIDPATNQVTDIVPVARDPSAIAIGAGGVWVTSGSEGAVTRIDPATRRRAQTIKIHSRPSAIAVANGSVWTAAVAAPAGHHGGTLRVESPGPFDPDRVEADVDPWLSRVTALVYDGLVAYRRTGGSTFGALVGDLAAAVPDPSPDGKSYVFKLRPGIRFSNGEPVRPEDVRASFEDLVRRRGVLDYAGIVGAPECAAHPERYCDLSEGIATDARTGTVTIRLAEPDPEILHKLTFPRAYVAPAKHPFGSRVPAPGTGPYRFVSYDRWRGARLVRNPHFRVWSQAARPEGFADEIVVRARELGQIDAQIADVQRGAADVVIVDDGSGGPLEPARFPALKRRSPGRLFIDSYPGLKFMFLNVRTPPFDDPRVRQALNYAVDRRVIADFYGGPDRADPTCQILPPGFPNYAPACRYTLNPDPSGAWTAPDLDRARRLIARSGTAGMEVTVWMPRSERATGQYFASLLRRLGYRTRLRMTAPLSYFDRVLDPSTRAQIGASGWGADYAAPSNYMVLFTCDGGFNLSRFCDRGLERRVDAARAANGPEAGTRWKDAYAYIEDAAPAVPLLNTRDAVLLSDRAGNYQHHPLWIVLLDQLWVR